MELNVISDKNHINQKHIDNGVIIIDPATAYISPETRIGAGSIIRPNTTIEGATEIGTDCTIGPNAILTDTRVGNGVSVLMSVITQSEIDDLSTIGPFAYLRPGTVLGKNVKVGDFVEIKNSIVGDGTKISHLTYVGDADVGKGVNFGCGSVTVNYDGKRKHRTTIEDNAFIGCNTNLIAPVTVSKNAYTAAGSTITSDVPENALAIARSRQKDIANWTKP